jgi:hypothetical protein
MEVFVEILECECSGSVAGTRVQCSGQGYASDDRVTLTAVRGERVEEDRNIAYVPLHIRKDGDGEVIGY